MLNVPVQNGGESDAAYRKRLCDSALHHWHMKDEATVSCCACPAEEPATAEHESAGPHDPAGDAPE